MPARNQNGMAMARAKRNGLIIQCEWMRARHLDEQALHIQTTLAQPLYVQLLQYIQALRTCMDPNKTDPTTIVWPAKPPFVP
jgi:hypothetical protein